MGLFELNKKLRVARQRGYTFNQTNKLTIVVFDIQQRKKKEKKNCEKLNLNCNILNPPF